MEKFVVTAITESNGRYKGRGDKMIIDFHTHVFPDKIAEKAIASLENNMLTVGGYDEHAVIGGTLDALKESMKENNIDISVVMPIATNIKQSTSINEFANKINGHDGIVSFGSVNPYQEDWEEVLEGIKSMGLLGIKLHPEYQDFYIDGEEAFRIIRKCEDIGLFVTLHAGADKGMKPPYHCTPDRLKNALKRLSGENIIAAHMGGYDYWDGTYKYLCSSPIYLDTSYAVGLMDDDLARRIIKEHGVDKILFATDSPWRGQGVTVNDVKALGLSKEETDAIFYKNALKILKLDEKNA